MPDGADRVGRIERRGIELVPAAERRRRPRELALVFAGAQMTFGALLTGALPLAMGLRLVPAIAAVVIGNLLGALLVAAMAPVGIATASNLTVASVATFGVRGRYLGSAITQAIDIGYFALTLVLAVPAIDEALRLLAGIAPSRGVTLATMAATSVLTVALGYAGHATVVAAQKLNLVLGAVVIALLAGFALAHPALAHAPSRVSPLVLFGTAVSVQFANALSWAPYVGDAARYVTPEVPARRAFAVTLAGVAAGALLSTGAGLLVATRVADPGDALRGMVDLLPLPLVAPVVLAGAIGNAASGAVLIYNGMLDLQSILWRLARPTVGLLFSAAGVAIAFAALVLFDLARALETMCTLVGLVLTPWIAVILADAWSRPATPDPRALRDFARTLAGNPYWRQGGLDRRALFAWACGAAFGFAGHVAGRIDAGVPLAAVIAFFVFTATARDRR